MRKKKSKRPATTAPAYYYAIGAMPPNYPLPAIPMIVTITGEHVWIKYRDLYYIWDRQPTKKG